MACLRGILTLIMLLSWALHVLHGQTNVTTHYTVADGLPITETTTVFADRAGRIWTAHLTGDATWYDGRRFHVFPITETGVQPLHFREDARGVWALDQYKAVARYAKPIAAAMRSSASTRPAGSYGSTRSPGNGEPPGRSRPPHRVKVSSWPTPHCWTGICSSSISGKIPGRS